MSLEDNEAKTSSALSNLHVLAVEPDSSESFASIICMELKLQLLLMS